MAPSWIYEDVNKAYFDWMAQERGVTHDDITGEHRRITTTDRHVDIDRLMQR